MLEQLPIGRKLTLIIFISNLVVLLMVFTITSIWNVSSIKSASLRAAEHMVEVFGQDFTKIVVLDSPRVAADTVSRLRAITNIKNAVLFDLKNNPVFSYQQPDAPRYIPAMVSAPRTYFEDGYLNVFSAINYQGTRYGTVYYRISTDLLDQTLRNYAISIALFLVVVIFTSLLMSYRFQKIFSAPVVYLAGVLDKVAKDKNLSIRVHTNERNEIGQLYHGFNTMIENIAEQHGQLEDKNRELNRHRDELEYLVAERTKELNDYAKEMEAFSYSVSHDLRAPLRSINGFSAMLLEDYAHLLDDPGKDILARIQGASIRMGELIDNLLQLSRIDQYDINPETVNLSDIAHTLVDELLEGQAANADVEVKIQPDIHINADAKLMRIVMDNLLSNAFKYSAHQQDPRIEVGCIQKANNLIIFVRDNGIGFDMKYADKLFIPFERLHSAEQYQGTGVGLATVKRIVVRHGGSIWAESEKHHGTTFYFQLDQHREARAKHAM